MNSSGNESIAKSNYASRTPDYYFQALEPELRDSFTHEQTEAIYSMLNAAIPKSNPKLVDLRFVIDLVLARFYVVLYVGKDRRQQKRSYLPSSVARAGNTIGAVVLLLGLNLLISIFLFLLAYLLKSAAGIDLFPDAHLGNQLQKLR